MKELIFVKYGGSIITDKAIPLSVSHKTIEELNKQIEKLTLETDYAFIIGNGGGSFGHYYAKTYQLSSGKLNSNKPYGLCVAKNGNSSLNRHVVESLLCKNVAACSVRIDPSYWMHGDSSAWNLILACLNNRVIPVLYGDILFLPRNKHRIVSTEQAFLDLAMWLSASKTSEYSVSKFVICSATNGVLTEDGRTISRITGANNITCFWSNSEEYDVTGGMRTKLDISLQMSMFAPVKIVDGKESDAIIRAVNGEDIGTTIECSQIQ